MEFCKKPITSSHRNQGTLLLTLQSSRSTVRGGLLFSVLSNCELDYLQTNLVSESESRSVVSDCLRPLGLYCPWDSPGQNTGVGSCFLLWGIFPTQGLNPGLLHCRWILHLLSHRGSLLFLKYNLHVVLCGVVCPPFLGSAST